MRRSDVFRGRPTDAGLEPTPAPAKGETELPTIRVASWLFTLNGAAWGVFAIPFAFYIDGLGRLPVIVGIESLSGPISDTFGHQAVVWLLIPMGFLSWLEVLAGRWLRKGRKEGAWLGLFLLPVSTFFWIGFLLPAWLLLGPLRAALILRGWRHLR